MSERPTVPLQWGHLFSWWVGPQHPASRVLLAVSWALCLAVGAKRIQKLCSRQGKTAQHWWCPHQGAQPGLEEPPWHIGGHVSECRGRMLPPRAQVYCFTWGRVEWEWWWPHLWGEAIRLCREDKLEVCMKPRSWATECKEGGTMKDYNWMNVGRHSQDRGGWELVFSGSKRMVPWPSNPNL